MMIIYYQETQVNLKDNIFESIKIALLHIVHSKPQDIYSKILFPLTDLSSRQNLPDGGNVTGAGAKIQIKSLYCTLIFP